MKVEVELGEIENLKNQISIGFGLGEVAKPELK